MCWVQSRFVLIESSLIIRLVLKSLHHWGVIINFTKDTLTRTQRFSSGGFSPGQPMSAGSQCQWIQKAVFPCVSSGITAITLVIRRWCVNCVNMLIFGETSQKENKDWHGPKRPPSRKWVLEMSSPISGNSASIYLSAITKWQVGTRPYNWRRISQSGCGAYPTFRDHLMRFFGIHYSSGTFRVLQTWGAQDIAYIYMCVCAGLHQDMSICLSVYLSICLSVYLSIYLSIYLILYILSCLILSYLILSYLS